MVERSSPERPVKVKRRALLAVEYTVDSDDGDAPWPGDEWKFRLRIGGVLANAVTVEVDEVNDA